MIERIVVSQILLTLKPFSRIAVSMAALSCAGFLEIFSYAMTLRVLEVMRSLSRPARDVNGSYQSDSAHSDIVARVLRQ